MSARIVLGKRVRAGMGCFVTAVLTACTSSPHIGHEAYEDAWGDRGPQVHARDVAWCAEAVESRRSLMNGCMRQRGWVAREGAPPLPMGH